MIRRRTSLPTKKSCWRELKRITVAGVLTLQDRWTVEVACLLMAKVRRREVLLGCERSQLSGCIGRLGLSPADRARITVAPPVTANPFAEFAVHAVAEAEYLTGLMHCYRDSVGKPALHDRRPDLAPMD